MCRDEAVNSYPARQGLETRKDLYKSVLLNSRDDFVLYDYESSKRLWSLILQVLFIVVSETSH